MESVIKYVGEQLENAKCKELHNIDVYIPPKYNVEDYEYLSKYFNSIETKCKVLVTEYGRKYLNFKLYGANKILVEVSLDYINRLNRNTFTFADINSYIKNKTNYDFKMFELDNLLRGKFRDLIIYHYATGVYVKKDYYQKYHNDYLNKCNLKNANNNKIFNKNNKNNKYALNIIFIKQLKKRCLCNHDLRAYKVNIGILNKNTSLIETIEINANYCENCCVDYITNVELDSYIYNGESKYKILANYVYENEIMIKDGRVHLNCNNEYNDFNKEHNLHKMGYNVSSDLSDIARLNILKYATCVLGYKEVISHIEYLIARSDKVIYSKALSKWRSDLINIINYKASSNGIIQGIFMI